MKLPYLLNFAVMLALSAWVAPAHGQETAQSKITPRQIAENYGVSEFHQIEKILFTFNVILPGKDELISRAWEWEPKSDRVTFTGPSPDTGETITLTYLRKDLEADAAGQLEAIDRMFINDQYWLIFPCRLVWDSGVEITHEGVKPLPIGEGEAESLTVRYAGAAGYTPGDVYELYIGVQGLIDQWNFLKGGDPAQSRPAIWANHQKIGPLMVAYEHYNEDSTFRLWFSEMNVITTDGKTYW